MKVFFKGFYTGMKTFGESVIDVTNFIFLLPVYLLGVGVTSIIAKIFGRHFLNLKKKDKKAKTYWEVKENKKPKNEELFREF